MGSTAEPIPNSPAVVGAPSPDSGPNPTSPPFISVVIPVRNEEAHLGAILEDLLNQDYPCERFEVLVVDGQSTDGTAAVVEHFAHLESPAVRLFQNPGRLSSAGRNIGVRESRGDFVLFIDGHCRIPNLSLLAETARILRESKAECLCRPQPLTSPGNTWFQDAVAHARATWIGHGSDSMIYTTNLEGLVNPVSSGAGYKRSVFSRVGHYDERFDACEDVEFNLRVYRAGIRSYLSPRLAIAYQPRASLAGLFRQTARYGKGRFRLMAKHKDAAGFSQLVPAAFVAGLVVLAGGSLVSSLVCILGLAAMASYTALLLTFSVALGIRYAWRDFFVAPFIYLIIHLGFGVGYWIGAFETWRDWWRARKPHDPAPPGPKRPTEPGQFKNQAA